MNLRIVLRHYEVVIEGFLVGSYLWIMPNSALSN